MIPTIEPIFLEATNLEAGDVILCYSPEMQGQNSGCTHGYSHAAICIDSSNLLESAGGGVRNTSALLLLDEYAHLAVLRNSEVWGATELARLKQFSSECIGKEFNTSGLKRYESNKTEYQNSATERVHKYFQGKGELVSPERESYFCSELVAAAFIYVGILHESAALLFIPETFMPEDIANDKAFGFFAGYLIPYHDYKIPTEDMFRCVA